MSDLTPGAALAQLLSAKTLEEQKQAQENLDAAHAVLIQEAAAEGISMKIETTFSGALNEVTPTPSEEQKTS